MYGATAGQIGILRFEAATNQAICGIFPHKCFVPEFLFYFFLSEKDELVAQAERMLGDAELRRRLRQNGRRRALTDHTWEKRFRTLFRHLGLILPRGPRQ